MDEDKLKAFMDSQENYVEIDPDATCDAGHLVVNWGRKGVGFGQLSFQEHEGVIHLDNETMGRDFCMSVLNELFVDAKVVPPLLRRFASAEALLDACVLSTPW